MRTNQIIALPVIAVPDCRKLRWIVELSFKAIVSVLCFVAAHVATAQDSTAEGNEPRDRHEIIVVVGAAGSDEFGDQFADWADQWRQLAEKAEVKWTLIGGRTELAADDPAATDRKLLQRAVGKLAGQEKTPRTTPAWLVLIGHGTYAGQTAKFNLRGPDVSATELASWLARIKRPLVIVNCASASGPFINRLSGSRRVIVTATKSGTEQNFARFGKFFSSAIGSADSDLDHDDEVSVQEAFLRASAEVSEFYETEARISTEHALIDDNGDQRGTPAKMFRGVRPIAKAKDAAELDGRLAATITLAPFQGRITLTPQERRRRDTLEQELEELRQQKDEMDDEAYDQRLEPIMIRLAKIYRAAEQRLQAQNE